MRMLADITIDVCIYPGSYSLLKNSKTTFASAGSQSKKEILVLKRPQNQLE